MKIATIIARTLLGLIFVVFGLNAFLNFIPLPPPLILTTTSGAFLVVAASVCRILTTPEGGARLLDEGVRGGSINPVPALRGLTTRAVLPNSSSPHVCRIPLT